MNKSLLFVVLGAALPACLQAAAVNYATYVMADGIQSQFTDVSDLRNSAPPEFHVLAQADLGSGALRTLNQRLSGPGGLATQALFYDTITFDPSGFQGSFGASYNLNLTAQYDGTFSKSGTIDSGGTGGRIHIYSGSTQIDSSVFADANSLINFMFISGPAPLCANGVNGPDFATATGAFSFSVSCSVTVTAANPKVRIFMNLPTFINAGTATWELDMLNTATLSLGDLESRIVYSGSGALPGTLAAVPEPHTMLMFALGAAAIAMGRLGARRFRIRG